MAKKQANKQETQVQAVEGVAEVLAQAGEQIQKTETVVAQVEHKVTKADIGRKIFEEELAKGSARKDIIARLVGEAGLTKNGAATYLQNMRNKAGLVVHKAKVEEAAA